MSADNYYLVVPNPRGGFTPVMRFASEDDPDTGDRGDLPRPAVTGPIYDTPGEALSSVIDEYAEYGHSIAPDCYRVWAATLDEENTALKAENARLKRQISELVH